MENEIATTPPEAAADKQNDDNSSPPKRGGADENAVTTMTIPGYRILRRLGQGGTAAVYLAIQESFGREVALKIMSPMLNADPTFTMRFVREARIVAQMHHASIVPVFDVGEHHPYHYLSMEYLPGGDLRQRIVEGRSSPALALDVCMAVSGALELAHRKGFVHRDIKPQNILFREDGAPVLTDFGIARAVDVGTSLTVAGMLVGTPAYMSPEQVKGLELDGRTDLYSLGMVFYEMLTGHVPFRTDSDSTLSIAMKHLSDTLPPLPPEYSHFQPVIDKLTAKERDHRFATASDVVRALRGLNDGQSSRAHTFIGTRPRRNDGTTEAMPAPAYEPTRPATERPTPPSPQPASAPPAAAPKRAAKQPLFAWLGAAVAVAVVAVGAMIFLRKPSDATKPQPLAQTAQVTQDTTASPAGPPSTANVATPLPPPSDSAPIASTSSSHSRLSADEAPLQSNEPAARVATTTTAPLPPQRTAEDLRRQREAAALADRSRMIESHLAHARDDYARGALVSPASENAADRYRAVLRIDPQNLEARAGLNRIGDRLVADAERARAQDEIPAALALLEQARSVSPDHPRLSRLELDLRERLVGYEQRKAARLQKATQLITRAEQALARSPMVLDHAVDADKSYENAQRLNPNAPGLNGMKERIAGAYVAAAEYEMSRNAPKRAINTINYARRRGVNNPRLAEIERIALQSVR